MSFSPVFTDVGRTASAIDNGKGLRTQISSVGLGSAQYAIRNADGMPLEETLAATSLQNELIQLPVYAGGDTLPGQINVVAEVPIAGPDDPQFFIGEIGFYDDSGTLIAIWSDDTQNMGYRGDLMGWYLNLTLAWVDLPSDQFTVQVLNGPLSEQIILTSQLNAQIRSAVEASGATYNPGESTQLADAMGNGTGGDALRTNLLAMTASNVDNSARIIQQETDILQLKRRLDALS